MKTTRNPASPKDVSEGSATLTAKSPRQRMHRTASVGTGSLQDIEDDGDDSQFVGSVARALAVLEAFQPGDGPLGNAEIAERTKLTKPTISRLAYTLARCGYLTFNARHRQYQLGPRLIALSHMAASTTDARRLARPLMMQLAQQANFNVGLGTRDHHEMVYTDACEGEGLVGLRLFVGSRIPIMTTAMGRAYLAGLEPAERENLLEELKAEYGSNWAKLRKALDRAIEEVAKYGYCVSAGEWQKDIHGVAAPIRAGDGQPTYAINLGGPAYLLPESRLRGELGKRIANIAREIEAALRPPSYSSGHQ